MDIKLIRAFIASPGGLDDERTAAFNAAEEVNRSVAKPLGGRLELYGWEETISGNGRPQAIINAEMETCDLFIGAMWTRWGSRPSLDGPYSSGFEEEFELSKIRYSKTRAPMMAMFFKDIDPLQLSDPGEELKKVLSFQERLRTEKSLFYGTFGTIEVFSAKVREFLSAHVIRMLSEGQVPREERPTNLQLPLAPSAEILVIETGVQAVEAPFLVATARNIRSDGGLPAADVARLRLIGATARTADNDKVVLGIHDANLLYERRQDYMFSFPETRGLLASGLENLADQNVPIWTWLSMITDGRPDMLMALTIYGEDAQRAGAIQVMRLLSEPIRQLAPSGQDVVSSHWLGERTPKTVKQAALRYLRQHGSREELAAIILEVARANHDTVRPAHEAAVAILLRVEPIEAARVMLTWSFDSFDADLLRETLEFFDQLDPAELRSGLDHRAAEVRSRSLEILSKQQAIDIETINRAREDDAAAVRLQAVQALERIEQPLSLDEARKLIIFNKRKTAGFLWSSSIDRTGEELFNSYRMERLRQMPVTAVEALLGSMEHRDAAYQSLAIRRVADFPAQLRQDLDDEFTTYFERHWPEGIPVSMRAATSLLTIGITDPNEIKRRELVSGAIDIVARERNEADLLLVRRVLDRGFVKPTPAVISFLRAFGDGEDIERLAQTPSLFWTINAVSGGSFREAALAILRLHVSSLADLMMRVLPDTMKAQLIDLVGIGEFSGLEDREIIDLLLDESALTRRTTARKIVESLPRSRVRRLLKLYRSHGEGRYYIVTHWLDLGLAYPRRIAKRVLASD
ncbi:DUF4062 domain-containing protein [Sphingomonas sp. AOB5]|uniref:DUF4062 domain-containing protein n=1 Tax=Sphingomonas sp. AOB5 TaxID=3034017 RepID=UPI0023F778EF|nr:DUF4062 domain-containing protein [Sphingomonas sp. AOB5]MDF7777806.1 DUF4062 domain-containing protein [Sphingomonas sp. AOB5]